MKESKEKQVNQSCLYLDDFELGFLYGSLHKLYGDSKDPYLYEIVDGIVQKIGDLKHALKVLDEGPSIGVQLKG